MKISELYKKRNSVEDVVFSCEIFPPKSEKNIETIYNTIKEIKEIAPDFISVTYGAGGGTRERTLEIASNVKNKYDVESLMHLTCVNSTKEKMIRLLKKVKQNNVENILALRGDIPSELEREEVVTDFCHATDLINFIKKKGDFSIGVAGYPEVHPESRNRQEDINYHKVKVQTGADFIITQLFFNNEHFYSFRDQMSSQNISAPISAGIMPVFKASLVKKMVSISGASIPKKLQNIIRRYGEDDNEMYRAGIDYASKQIQDLINQGVSGIHLYTMNRSNIAFNIARNTGLRKI